MIGFIAFRWLFKLTRTFLICMLQENRSSSGIDPLLSIPIDESAPVHE